MRQLSTYSLKNVGRHFNEAVKRHKAALWLALLVSAVYGSHHFFIAKLFLADEIKYHPVTMESNFDESIYAARANAVFQGQLFAGDITLAENKGSPSLLPILNPAIMGILGRVLGSIESAFIFSDFLFPPIIFIILYLLAFEITGRKTLSLFFSTLFIFIPKIFLTLPPISPSLLKTFFFNILPDPNNGLYFGRFEYPKITYLFSALTYYLSFRSIKRGETTPLYLAGLFFGLSFYTYLYDWVYFLVAVTITCVGFIILKKNNDALKILKIIGIGFLISAPYWLNFLLLNQLPHYPDLANRIGIEISDDFRFLTVWKSYLRNILLIGALIFLLKKTGIRLPMYLIGFLAAYFFVVNLQVVLGYNPHPDHWYRVTFLPIALSTLAILHAIIIRFINNQKSFWTEKIRGYGKTAAVIIIILIFGRSQYSEYLFSAQNAKSYSLDKAAEASYEWLDANTPRGANVASLSPQTNGELPIYTANKTFLPNGFHTTASDEFVWKRFMETSAMFGITENKFAQLAENSGYLLYLFHNEYRDRTPNSNFEGGAGSGRKISKEFLERKLEEYKKVSKTGEKLLRGDNSSEYLYFGPLEQSIGTDPAKRFSGIEKVYDRDNIRIYKTGL